MPPLVYAGGGEVVNRCVLGSAENKAKHFCLSMKGKKGFFMLTQFHVTRKRSPGNIGTTGDALVQLFLSAVITAALSLLPAQATPAKAHNEPSTCSVTTNATTGYKQIFVGHIKDGEALYRQQNGASKQIYRGHTYTNRPERVDVYASNGWTWVCGG